jgi:protein-disulfide isomerase/uncharacterized membrane protein
MATKKSRRRGPEQPTFNKNLLWVAVGFAAIGLLLSSYATQLTFRIATLGLVEASGCSINDFVNCDLAHSSSYASLLGIPVAWWGFLFYAFAGLSALWGTMAKDRRGAAGWITLAFVLSIGAVLFSGLKAYHLTKLGVLCLVCVGMYAANIGLLIFLPLAIGYGPGRWGTLIGGWIKGLRGEDSGLKMDPRISRWGLLALVVFGFGFMGMKRYADNVTAIDPNWNTDLALNAHFRQTPIQVDVDPEAAVWGNPDGAVKIVEFADFQCPACRESAFHLRTTLFEYRDDVALYFMNYPLDSNFNDRMTQQIHTQAGPAAVAAVCAQEFGEFWEYHDELFRQQVSLGPNLFTRAAEDLGYPEAEFAECLTRQDVRDRVLSDIASGMATGLTQTPTIFINGRKASAYRNSEFIRAIIERELSGS